MKHLWRVSVSEAIAIQESLKRYICFSDGKEKIERVAGVDGAYYKYSGVAAAVVCRYPTLEVLEEKVATEEVDFPYIPGLLAFREGPLILKTLAQLSLEPDLFFFNGHGLAHPRGLGLATHLGILLDKPSVGCARRLLPGFTLTSQPGPGSFAPVEFNGRKVGLALRTPYRGQLLFVSPGHRISMEKAMAIVKACLCEESFLPWPLYLAHSLAAQKKEKLQPGEGENG